MEYRKLDLSGIQSQITDANMSKFQDKGILASGLALGAGAVEGVLEFGESGANLLALGAASIGSIFTLAYDSVNGTNVTENMWESTRAFVSTKKVENAFDSMYNNTSVGRYIRDNAYNFEGCRNVGKAFGNTGCTLLLDTVTGGVGGTIITGAMAFADNTGDAWANGASLRNGLTYGATSAAWQTIGTGAVVKGLGGAAGGVIRKASNRGTNAVARGVTQNATNVASNTATRNGVNIAREISNSATNAASNTATRNGVNIAREISNSATNAASNTATRNGFKNATKKVVKKGVKGATGNTVDSIAQPALDTIYKDYEQDNAVDNYKESFKESGGVENVVNSATGGFKNSVIDKKGRMQQAASRIRGTTRRARS